MAPPRRLTSRRPARAARFLTSSEADDDTMADDGGTPPGGDGTDTGPERLPPDLRELGDELRDVRFEPRDGLEDEVVARIARVGTGSGERSRVARGGWRRAAGAAAAVLAAVAALALLERLDEAEAPGRHGGGAWTPTPAAAGWAVRWGPDARVLALGSSRPRARPPGDRELRCGSVDGRIRCRGSELDGHPPGAVTEAPAVLRDFCCLDYDAGGRKDDGVRVVAGRDEAVVDFWIYEDRDGTRSFSAGDLLRTVLPAVPAAGSEDPPRDAVRRLDRCCADLDGGPSPDDGLFVVAGGSESVALAVLYEDETGDGRLSPGDRLRAVRSEGGRSDVGDEPEKGVQ